MAIGLYIQKRMKIKMNGGVIMSLENRVHYLKDPHDDSDVYVGGDADRLLDRAKRRGGGGVPEPLQPLVAEALNKNKRTDVTKGESSEK